MIELNLLPEELRKKKKRLAVEMPQISIMPVVIGVVAVIIIAHISSLFLVMKNKRSLNRLTDKWNLMQPQRQKTEKVTRQIASLKKRVTAVRKIAKSDLDWVKLLSGLNKAVIPKIWLSNFELKFQDERTKKKRSKDKKQKNNDSPVSVEIVGYALGKSEQATSLVAKFITSLKNNRDFSDYFKDIELENMRNSEIDGEELMMFKLECRVKTAGVVLLEGKSEHRLSGK